MLHPVSVYPLQYCSNDVTQHPLVPPGRVSQPNPPQVPQEALQQAFPSRMPASQRYRGAEGEGGGGSCGEGGIAGGGGIGEGGGGQKGGNGGGSGGAGGAGGTGGSGGGSMGGARPRWSSRATSHRDG